MNALKSVGLLLLTLAMSAPSFATELSLPQASALLLQHNPKLQLYSARFKLEQANQAQAALRPEYELELELSDFAGSGEYQGIDQLETTLALSSVFELGDKRQARINQAQGNYALAQAERELEALAQLGGLTRSFIKALALQERCGLAGEYIAHAQRTQTQLKRLNNSGKSAEAELLQAKVALVQAKLASSQCQIELQQSYYQIANLLGQQEPEFTRLKGSLYQLGQLAPLAEFQAKLEHSATLRLFSQQAQLQTAELALAQSQSTLDLSWRLGVSHYRDSQDIGLSLGLSAPLRSAKRNYHKIKALEAEQALQAGVQSQELQRLKTELVGAYQQFIQNRLAVQSLRYEAIPLLEQVLALSIRGFELGRYDYGQWQKAQAELLEAKANLIASAESALLNQAVIEELVGEKIN